MIGFPIPDTNVKILDKNGCEVLDGEIGEIVCKGP